MSQLVAVFQGQQGTSYFGHDTDNDILLLELSIEIVGIVVLVPLRPLNNCRRNTGTSPLRPMRHRLDGLGFGILGYFVALITSNLEQLQTRVQLRLS